LSEKKADIITIPAAFTLETGKDHWEILCRTRAVETQTYVLAAAQFGSHFNGDEKRACFGNSMIVDPWGHVIRRAPNSTGYISAALDFDYKTWVRQILPVANHHILK
jgi:nitrilase|tara:strand:- start:3489 stop:3809 length:321 start_codon:yes stop_codon:yes gene_type:complete